MGGKGGGRERAVLTVTMTTEYRGTLCTPPGHDSRPVKGYDSAARSHAAAYKYVCRGTSIVRKSPPTQRRPQGPGIGLLCRGTGVT